MSENPWQTLGSKTVYANTWMRLREDTVIRPDGQHGIYGVVEMSPSVGVVALNDVDEIALVTQWRYTESVSVAAILKVEVLLRRDRVSPATPGRLA